MIPLGHSHSYKTSYNTALLVFLYKHLARGFDISYIAGPVPDTKIYEHTIETLTRRYGESFMSTTPVDFVLTVPAVWSDAAKNATLQAAERAGMGNRHDLKLISEPEAAAVYTLKTIQPSGLKEGDNFIVCDAGG